MWEGRGLQWGLCILVVLLGTGCGGSSSSSSSSSNTTEVSGAAVKGPLVDAEVLVYELDPEAEGLKGDEVGSGRTTEQAAIEADLDDSAEGLLLVEVLADENTTDLTTGDAPVLSRLTTVADAEAWRDGQSVYATSLTHMAVGVATRNVGDNVESALARAQKAVRNTFGLALLDEDLDLFTSAPLLRTGMEEDERKRVLRYRKAAEATVAIVAAIQEQSTEDLSIEEVFTGLVDDLASGKIDGEDRAGDPVELGVANIDQALEDLTPEELEALEIPGADGKTVSDVLNVVNDEREAVGVSADEPQIEEDETVQKASADSGLDSLEGANVVLTLEVSPADADAGAIFANGETGGETGEVTVGADATVSLLAEEEEGFQFWEWVDGQDEHVAWRAEDEFSTGEDMTLKGVFYPLLSLEADPVEGAATTSGFDAQEAGSMVTVNADPALGFGFVEWRDAQGHRSFEESYTFEMPAAPLELTAVYELTNATVNEEGWGDISVSGTFEEGETVTYTAEPALGYRFVEWVDENTSSQVSDDASYEFELSQDTNLTAVFEPLDEGPDAAVWDQFNWDEAVWQ